VDLPHQGSLLYNRVRVKPQLEDGKGFSTLPVQTQRLLLIASVPSVAFLVTLLTVLTLF